MNPRGVAATKSLAVVIAGALIFVATTARKAHPLDFERWLVPQNWTRDTEGPVLSLGKEGSFDDQHIFAPCVARDRDRFLLWYCGSRGTVEDRIFGLGLMTGTDGRTFQPNADNPIFKFADNRH